MASLLACSLYLVTGGKSFLQIIVHLYQAGLIWGRRLPLLFSGMKGELGS